MVSLTGATTVDVTSSSASVQSGILYSAANDVILVAIALPSSTVSVSTINDLAGNSYLFQNSYDSSGGRIEIWEAKGALPSAANKLTVSLTVSTNYWAVSAASFAGVATVIYGSGSSSATSASVSAGAPAPVAGSFMMAAVASWPPFATSALQVGFFDTGGANSSRVHQVYGPADTKGSNTVSASISASQFWMCLVISMFPGTPWAGLDNGKPCVTVSPVGAASSGQFAWNNGADFGPDTPGSSTSGIQEALNLASETYGQPPTVVLLPGIYNLSTQVSLVNTVIPIRGYGAVLNWQPASGGLSNPASACIYVDGSSIPDTGALNQVVEGIVLNLLTDQTMGLWLYEAENRPTLRDVNVFCPLTSGQGCYAIRITGYGDLVQLESCRLNGVSTPVSGSIGILTEPSADPTTQAQQWKATGCEAWGWGTGVSHGSGNNFVIEHCLIQDCAIGLLVTAESAGTVFATWFESNTTWFSYTGGVSVVKVIDCWLTNEQGGSVSGGDPFAFSGLVRMVNNSLGWKSYPPQPFGVEPTPFTAAYVIRPNGSGATPPAPGQYYQVNVMDAWIQTSGGSEGFTVSVYDQRKSNTYTVYAGSSMPRMRVPVGYYVIWNWSGTAPTVVVDFD